MAGLLQEILNKLLLENNLTTNGNPMNILYISGFPQPVGRDTKTSFPLMKSFISSTCFFFSFLNPSRSAAVFNR